MVRGRWGMMDMRDISSGQYSPSDNSGRPAPTPTNETG